MADYDLELSEQIKKMTLKLGADLVGIADAEKTIGSSQGHANPNEIVSDAKAIIILALKYPDSAVDCKHEDDLIHANYVKVQHALNDELMRIAVRITRSLEKLGYDASPISPDIPREETRNIWTGVLSLRYLAQLAGLGDIGLSNLLLTPNWGPRVQLGAILTDAPLKPDGPQYADKICKKCQKCIEACPTRAFDPENYPPFNYNLNRCLWATQGWARLTKVQEPPPDWVGAKPNANIMIPKYEEKYPQIRIFEGWTNRLGDFPQCNICMAVCPIGKEGYQKRVSGE
ncbi:MAG: epoxyqueuosine reductase [Candidatus Helarchaeota archaeon]|nr:epoxyqueuosine reductase [Candidatus Helarchaeota archaeon]